MEIVEEHRRRYHERGCGTRGGRGRNPEKEGGEGNGTFIYNFRRVEAVCVPTPKAINGLKRNEGGGEHEGIRDQ